MADPTSNRKGAASDELLPCLYDELRKLAQARMAALAPGQTLQATALVHESYLRMVRAGDERWESRAHFFGAAARAMREILIEKARAKASLKRGGDRRRVSEEGLTAFTMHGLSDELVDLVAAVRKLSEEDPRKADVVTLRYFGGLTTAEIAQVLEVSTPTVERDWSYARAWLRREVMGGAPTKDPP